MSVQDHDQGQDMHMPLPKPYGFVPLPTQRPHLEPPAGHDRYHPELLTGQMSGVLIARSDIHVASGLLQRRPQDRQHPLVKAHMRTNGRPVIPGTSLKGCIRAIVEAISPSAVHITQRETLTSSRDSQFRANQGSKLNRDKQIKEMDPSARLFGMQGYLGAVRFSDALLEEGQTAMTTTPQLYAPQHKARHAYYEGTDIKGRKFYMHGARANGKVPLEVCPPSSRFMFVAHFDNLSQSELGLLLTAMGLGEPGFCPKLGGAKPACLGTIEVSDVRMQFFQPQVRYVDFGSEGADMAEIARFLTASLDAGLVLQAQLKRLADLLRWPVEDRSCPDRMY